MAHLGGESAPHPHQVLSDISDQRDNRRKRRGTARQLLISPLRSALRTIKSSVSGVPTQPLWGEKKAAPRNRAGSRQAKSTSAKPWMPKKHRFSALKFPTIVISKSPFK